MLATLESKAINAALSNSWEEASQYNLEILKTTKDDLEALSRLGRAYRAQGKTAKAIESFKKVLKIDPLNTIAQKNLEQLKNGTSLKNNNLGSALAGSFVIEPSTTKKVTAHLDTKQIDPKKIIPGQRFILEIRGDQVLVRNENNKVVGIVCEETCNDFLIARKVYHLKTLQATFLAISKGPWVDLLAKSNKPIFKGAKQEVNPEVRFVMDEEASAE